jgi:acyl carrier protein
VSETVHVRDVVSAAWRDVLSLDTAMDDDDFFLLGGHSLLAIKLVDRIESQLGIEFPFEELFVDARLSSVIQACQRKVASAGGSDS